MCFFTFFKNVFVCFYYFYFKSIFFLPFKCLKKLFFVAGSTEDTEDVFFLKLLFGLFKKQSHLIFLFFEE